MSGHDVRQRIRYGSIVLATEPWAGCLDAAVHGDARNVAPGWDVYHLEQEFRKWLGEEEIVPKNPQKVFVKFCKSWFDKRGLP